MCGISHEEENDFFSDVSNLRFLSTNLSVLTHFTTTTDYLDITHAHHRMPYTWPAAAVDTD